MRKGDLVKSTKKYMSGILFKIKRIGKQRVSLEIVNPVPDADGFVIKYFKTGRTESIHFFKERTMTREFFDKSFRFYLLRRAIIPTRTIAFSKTIGLSGGIIKND